MLFGRSGDHWTEQMLLAAPGPRSSQIAAAVALSDAVVLVGAPGIDTEAGGVYVFGVPNRPPTISAPADQTLAEDGATTALPFVVDDPETWGPVMEDLSRA